MKRYLLFLFLSVCGMASAYAQNDVKLEAESAAYTNCKLVEDNKYSGGKALELTESNAKITFTYTASEAGKYAVTLETIQAIAEALGMTVDIIDPGLQDLAPLKRLTP